MSATLLDARGVTRRHGARVVLENLDLTVHAGARLGLIGPNGSGKSTLLRILAGLEPPDSGTVRRLGTVGYVPQLVGAELAGLPAREAVLERIGVGAATRELERWEAVLERGEDGAIGAHASALERWVALGGADAEARIRQAAAELDLPAELLERPVGELSGGQAARVGLAAVCAARFDALLLDEPSNHLDRDGLARLREILRASPAAIVLVSHDRALLAEAVDEVVLLERDGGGATRWAGGWEAYERERATARERERREYEHAVRRRAEILEAEREMRRRAAASARRVERSANDGDKHAREWVRMRADGALRRARKVRGRAERDELPSKPREPARLTLELTARERAAEWVVALDGAVLRRGEWKLGPLDLAIRDGERVLLDGPNGSGKSSVLAALAGELPLAAGRRSVAASAAIARLGQDRGALAGARPVAAIVAELAGLGEADARTTLAGFGLHAEVVERQAASLSAGERTRAELALIARRRVRCLLLDEPTNHLDVESLEILEAALEAWPGALVVATHDARLREALRVERTVMVGHADAGEA